MQQLRTSPFLRWVLLADAATCTLTGLAMTFGSSLLEGLSGLPASLLFYSGLSLIPFAGVLGYLALREHLAPAAIWAVIALNVLWAIDSIALLATGWVAPTALGAFVVVAQALGVFAFAALEYAGLRRSTDWSDAQGLIG